MVLNTNTNSNSSSSSSSTTSSGSGGSVDKKQKKTVTFKNVLETSDDKSAVKKFYNPDNRKPLVSIIKKECLNRPFMYTRNSDCIVRPSRLTEILKNNSNIDKLNSLKFRSNHASSSSAATTTAAGSSENCSVLGGPLSRVFGAPSEEEDNKQQQNIINFRLTKEQSDDEDDDIDDDEDDDDEDDGMQEAAVENAEDEKKPIKNGPQAVNVSTKLESESEEKHKLKVGSENEDDDDDQQMIVDKHFVLPKRSCRSSRVIKPNKRLIEDGIICRKSSLKTIANHNSLNATLSSKEDKIAATAAASTTVAATTPQATNYFGLNDYNAKECNGSASKRFLLTIKFINKLIIVLPFYSSPKNIKRFES